MTLEKARKASEPQFSIPGSKAEEIGLKRGDQILEVNGQSFEHVTKHTRALEKYLGHVADQAGHHR